MPNRPKTGLVSIIAALLLPPSLLPSLLLSPSNFFSNRFPTQDHDITYNGFVSKGILFNSFLVSLPFESLGVRVGFEEERISSNFNFVTVFIERRYHNPCLHLSITR